ncbi:bifunctional ADP-dependent NAD(P)H-hydrate dehydratase/NAD(P)H-hydrate epimerase [Mariniluteicoccus endophyticus]
MKFAYSIDQVRLAEERALVDDDGELMQRAASGLAWAVRRVLRERTGGHRGRQVVLLVGPGNNGGDTLYAGVRLLRAGVRVRAWCQSDRFHARAAKAFQDAGGTWIGRVRDLLPALERVDAVVDGIYGIGGRAGLEGDLVTIAQRAAGSPAALVACDVPSGVDADTGRGDGFVADLTVTFGGLKPCHVTHPGLGSCGRVELVDIGLVLDDEPLLAVWEPFDVADVWPWPDATSDKYSRGVVGIDAGSPRYPGAAVLATGGAVHAGAGMVRFLGAGTVADRVVDHFPNVVLGTGRCQAHLAGSGWGDRRDARDRIESLLATNVPCVVDADGLTHLPPRLHRALLTPHAGELARLLGVERAAVEAEPIIHVRRAADDLGATVLLKGATQYVAAPGRRSVAVAVHGPAWTAQAGSGDTLAGVCATLLAAGLPAYEAAMAAASVQAMTAARHPGPRSPQELAVLMPDTIAALDPLGRIPSPADRTRP